MVPTPLAYMHDDSSLCSVYKSPIAIDLATILADGVAFDEPTARFYTASVATARRVACALATACTPLIVSWLLVGVLPKYGRSVALALEHLQLEAHRLVYRHVTPDGRLSRLTPRTPSHLRRHCAHVPR
jgi:hypothetical protein